MVLINIDFPKREIGVIVDKIALEKKEALAENVKEEFNKMSKSLYDKANGGVVNVVTGTFRGSFYDQRIDTKNKLGMIIGFDRRKCDYVDFILGGTVFMPPRDIVEMTKVEFGFPQNFRDIIASI